MERREQKEKFITPSHEQSQRSIKNLWIKTHA